MPKIYCARWVLPVASAPIQDGAVAVVGTRIDDVGPRARILFDYPDVEVEEFGDAVILPGFVNCHSHLELTAMRGFLDSEEGYFHLWLKKLTAARRERMSEEDFFVSAACGVAEALRAGVTCLGDASSAGAPIMRALREVGARGVVFHEVFGPDPALATAQFDGLRNDVSKLREVETDRVVLGVSPHAPYTVSAPLIELITNYAMEERLPLMMHAAESPAERTFVLKGTGLIADALRERGIEWRAPGVSTVQYLDSLGFLRARPLLAHCINVDEDDIALIKKSGARIAHCPKSNSKFGHGRAPFASFLSSEIDVGLGSDSVASNNTCDMLEEARFAMLLSRSSGDTLASGGMVGTNEAIRASTMGGARALGLVGKIGVLAPGCEADLVVVGLGGAHQQPVHDVATTLVSSSSGRDVVLTMVAGREVFRDGRVTTIDESELLSRLRITASRLYKA